MNVRVRSRAPIEHLQPDGSWRSMDNEDRDLRIRMGDTVFLLSTDRSGQVITELPGKGYVITPDLQKYGGETLYANVRNVKKAFTYGQEHRKLGSLALKLVRDLRS